jgi:HPt (histidine-containing phosphotransfer) domain-containing protein
MVQNEIDMATFEELKEMSGADFIDELIVTYLDDAPHLIDQMQTALKTQDAEVFRRAAHSLKSNSATFGANRLSLLAKELEVLGRENKLNEVGNRLDVLRSVYALVANELKVLHQ